MPDEIFDEFDRVPIASASSAQVHVARTHDGHKVAVKIQHTHMLDTAAADYATVELIVNTLHWLFPSFDYRWLTHTPLDMLEFKVDKVFVFFNAMNGSSQETFLIVGRISSGQLSRHDCCKAGPFLPGYHNFWGRFFRQGELHHPLTSVTDTRNWAPLR